MAGPARNPVVGLRVTLSSQCPDGEESAYGFFVYEAHQPDDDTDFPA
jgi:hypothetical protein